MKEQFLCVDHESSSESLRVPDVDGVSIVVPVGVEQVAVVAYQADRTRERNGWANEEPLADSVLIAVHRKAEFKSLYVQPHIVDIGDVDIGDSSIE